MDKSVQAMDVKNPVDQLTCKEEQLATVSFGLAFAALSILTLMSALDATSLSIALPVRGVQSEFLRH
ncbi:hypothetical protein EYZ11_011574 [Aspergillus tanneri]|uniref:Uncharacterized protein n=1 Tax=Aspergillus tanneri TaxID=1220188 RepID=A0A4S3J2T4_9EURO|nr:hypothetical protein EYZ11_011574 [Aspergillus tanneri]